MFVLSLQIYTDWANHYLAKSGCPRLIKDLSQDVTDGVLLAQIIQIIGRYTRTHTCADLCYLQLWLRLCLVLPHSAALGFSLCSSYSFNDFSPFSSNLHDYHDSAENSTSVTKALHNFTSGLLHVCYRNVKKAKMNKSMWYQQQWNVKCDYNSWRLVDEATTQTSSHRHYLLFVVELESSRSLVW